MSCDAKAAALTIENVSWRPQKGDPIISGISFGVARGERVAVIGPNGAGKSTLLRCLYRASKPTTGTIQLDGADIWSLPARNVARKIAAVLQEMPSDFPFTVMDIVLMGRIPHRRGVAYGSEENLVRAQHALDHLGLSRFAARSFATLSGGEKQRVLVARALAQDPGLIILDEPTNHLDIRHQLDILQILKGLAVTVVTTLHDINLASDFADKIALMSTGCVTNFGPPSKVLTGAALGEVFNVNAHRYLAATGRGPRFFFTVPTKTTKMETIQ